MNRRTLLHYAAALPGLTTLPVAAVSPPSSTANPDTVVAGGQITIAETTAGRISGYVRRGVATFKGVPYGDTTAGAHRFLPPRPPQPWTGVRSCRQLGPIAPQSNRGGMAPHNDEEAFVMGWDDAIARVYRPGASEDCLRLNLWTPAIDHNRRAVMVWIHGGRFAWGSSSEQPAYDGENLARTGDVVVVTLNHRLNVFGHLNLADFGEAYASSGNASMLDLVAALQWVRENIAQFGGDPGRVTIMGQSGGGSKVGFLMSMPAAKCLFHRAIVQSGSMPKAGDEAATRRLAAETVKELGLDRSTIHQIHTFSVEQIQQAADRAMHRFALPGNQSDFDRIAESWGWVPTLDGKVIVANPFDAGAAPISQDIPMIIGSNLNEFFHSMDHPEFESMTVPELEERVQKSHGARAPAILAAFRKRSPHVKPFDLWSQISAAPTRAHAIGHCQARATMRAAPSYLYWYCWQTPVLDGRPRAFHGAEIPAVFQNTDRCDTLTGGGDEPRRVAHVVSGAWVQFAKTGNPNGAGLPAWQPFQPGTVPTMVFARKSLTTVNPDGEEQASFA